MAEHVTLSYGREKENYSLNNFFAFFRDYVWPIEHGSLPFFRTMPSETERMEQFFLELLFPPLLCGRKARIKNPHVIREAQYYITHDLTK
jgi:hypothetical protein